jgi:hypothetical protein
MANELLLSYSVLDGGYTNGLIKKIEGERAGSAAEVNSITDPDETYVPLGPMEPDPKMFSFAYGQDPAILIARVSTSAGSQPSSCKYTLAAPDASCGKAWKVLSQDVSLYDGNTPMATNPYGVAQVGNMLYIIDYDSAKITLLGVNELNGLEAGNHTLAYPPYDLGTAAGLSADSKGQAIIALTNGNATYLFALFTVAVLNPYPTPPAYSPSVLVRMTIAADGTPQYVDKLDTLAKNAQELIVMSISNTPYMFIPSLGGGQKSDGTTNGIDSKLEEVDPFAATMTAIVRLTGDPASPSPSTWDIRAFAAPLKGDTSPQVYILTGTMDTSYNQRWTLYNITVSNLRSLSDAQLSQAGLDWAGSGEGAPGNFWDIFYETGTDPAGSRLWFLKGSPIYITSAESYGTPDKLFDTGYGEGKIGGINVNGVTLVAETMRQVSQGLSLKRGLRGITPILPPAEETEEK